MFSHLLQVVEIDECIPTQLFHTVSLYIKDCVISSSFRTAALERDNQSHQPMFTVARDDPRLTGKWLSSAITLVSYQAHDDVTGLLTERETKENSHIINMCVCVFMDGVFQKTQVK